MANSCVKTTSKRKCDQFNYEKNRNAEIKTCVTRKKIAARNLGGETRTKSAHDVKTSIVVFQNSETAAVLLNSFLT